MPDYPEVFLSNAILAGGVNKALAAGQLRKLASRLYSTNLKESPETLVRRNLWPIVAAYFPDALIADRTALDLRPASDGSIFLIANSAKEVELPGVRLRPRKGAGPLPGDHPMRAHLMCSSQARALLENMKPSRAREGVARTLKRDEIEQVLEGRLRINGEEGLNRLRDEIKGLAPALNMQAESAQLDAIIGTLLGTRDAPLSSSVAVARQKGEPFDPRKVEKFELLHDTLRGQAPPLPRLFTGEKTAAINFAFFEAYFSNFIEGTEFDISEAKDIVFEGVIPAARPADAHDIVGTFTIVSDESEMTKIPKDYDEFITLLELRHGLIMEGRPEKAPGKFKETRNRAGATTFVDPGEVRGTLRQGFAIYKRLDLPLHRAIFMMFLVSEVHPFTDGNGRAARIMMNAELATVSEVKIIVPTIYRSNYLSSLKALSLSDNPTPLIRTLDFAQKYASSIDWNDFNTALHVLGKTNAFIRPEDGDDQGIRLRLAVPADYVGDENDGGDGTGGGASGGPK